MSVQDYLISQETKALSRKNYSMDEIRGMYGSQAVESKPYEKIATG